MNTRGRMLLFASVPIVLCGLAVWLMWPSGEPERDYRRTKSTRSHRSRWPRVAWPKAPASDLSSDGVPSREEETRLPEPGYLPADAIVAPDIVGPSDVPGPTVVSAAATEESRAAPPLSTEAGAEGPAGDPPGGEEPAADEELPPADEEPGRAAHTPKADGPPPKLDTGDDCGGDIAGDCPEGTLCVGPVGDEGKCLALCDLERDDGCGVGEDCAQVAFYDEDYEGYGLCVLAADCSVLDQSGCPEGAACVPIRAVVGWTRMCQEAGEIPEHGECDVEQQCVPGHGCWSVSGSPRLCRRYCALGTTCPDGTPCLAAEITIDELGICP